MVKFEATISLKQNVETEKKGFVMFQAPQHITKTKIIEISSDYNIDKVMKNIEEYLKKEYKKESE